MVKFKIRKLTPSKRLTNDSYKRTVTKYSRFHKKVNITFKPKQV